MSKYLKVAIFIICSLVFAIAVRNLPITNCIFAIISVAIIAELDFSNR